MLREPAKSCFSCRRALRPDEVLYTESGEVVCDGCGPSRPGATVGLKWREALDHRRRANHRRWIVSGIVFGWMVAGLFVAWRMHARLTLASIDSPAPLARAATTMRVRGHVVSEGLHQPVWLVAQAPDRCPSDPFFAARVVARPDGTWESVVRLDGEPWERVLLTVVATDEIADAALERAAEDRDGPDRPAAGDDGPCRPLPGGWLDLPSGSVALASRSVIRSDTLAGRAGDHP